ncbi:NDP-hexose 2,3-dehydratase [Sinosporangium siamense]|uniref:NDP-hexose 2,3-dehydratase n=1 Tax=Sinosporangium siamense TaxID=1367973 RepID=A0A919RDZ2_9ACTN|nr:NDP-hexose 2,3-dehydratase [Sinosporangium siamense]
MENEEFGRLLVKSALAGDSSVVPLAEFEEWYARQLHTARADVERIPFAELEGWDFDPATGNLGHRSGRFFSVEGLAVTMRSEPFLAWSQPIIDQPEVGILGLLAKEIDGVLHFLMQGKMEPGNINSVQLSPTVQATHSNYIGVHRGANVPYLDYFIEPRPGRVILDVLQSEHGSWFWCKRNRNIVVLVDDDVPARDGFCWLTLGQLHELLRVDNLINMDSRTVLACLPFPVPASAPGGGSEFHDALVRSSREDVRGLHSAEENQSWFTEARTRPLVERRRVGLGGIPGWSRSEREITHEDGKYFKVAAVAVQAGNREVRQWTQPLFVPVGHGVAAFLTKTIGGVLHLLVQARLEPGLLDVVELGPTVQCTPENYAGGERPAFLDYVLAADAGKIRYEARLSEEGGRFLHAVSRYLVIETDEDFPLDVPPGHRWMTVAQLTGLLRHSYYLNVQARTLIACLRSL